MRTWLTRATIAAALMFPLATGLGPLLTGGRILAYRDAAHFYYPLYAWISQCWGQGHLPLWNPQQGSGQPVVAQATSAVFYPGKLIFALPVPYHLRFNAYVIVHMLLAALATYWTARRWQASRPAAALAGISYAAGGSVLFQTCNVVLLVGAAWLPVSLLAADGMLRERSARWALVLGVVLALMVLGGDPHGAYHAGMLAALYAILLWGKRLRADLNGRGEGRAAVGKMLGLLTLAACTAGLLAAIQIVPSVRWTDSSRRAAYRYPRSVWEIPEYWSRGPADRQAAEGEPIDGRWEGVVRGLFGSPVPRTHHRYAYHFSVAPWRCAELVWPNCSGRSIPTHQRWLAAVGGEGRIWTPSLYLGLLPLLLSLRSWTLRGPDVRIRWLSWIALLGLVGSFGWYGPGWLVQQLRWLAGAQAVEQPLGAPTGGLYWLFMVLLPGYASFRFPAKLFTCTALGLALLSARGMDRLPCHQNRGLRRCLLALALLSVGLSGVLVAARPWWNAQLAQATADELFGPMQVAEAWWSVQRACWHTTAVALAGWWLIGRSGAASSRRDMPHCRATASASDSAAFAGSTAAPVLLLVLTAVEITVANRWLVVTAPVAAMQIPSMLQDLKQAEPDAVVGRFYRPPDRRWVPQLWRTSTAEQRPAQTVAWDRRTLFPNYHLLESSTSVDPQRTIESRFYAAWLRSGSNSGPHPHALNVLGTTHLLLPEDQKWPQAEPLAARSLPDNARVWSNLDAYPRAWVVHQLQLQPAPATRVPEAVDLQIQKLLLADGRPRDLRQTAIVAMPADQLPSWAHASGQHRPDLEEERCRVTACDPCRLVVEANLQQPGLLVVSDMYAPGWIVDVHCSQAETRRPVLRANHIMRGVLLPAGQHRLVFRYQPLDFYLAAGISLAAWAAVLIWAGWAAKNRA